MGARQKIYLGDLVRVVKHLNLKSTQDIELAANILGLSITEPAELTVFPFGTDESIVDVIKPNEAELSTQLTENVSDKSPTYEADGLSQQIEQSAALSYSLITSVIDFQIEGSQVHQSVNFTTAQWQDVAVSAEPVLRHHTLIAAHQSRGVIKEVLSIPKNTRQLDLQKVIPLLAQLVDPARLPTAVKPMMASACQLLADTSKGMAPFTRDRQGFMRHIKQIMGSTRVTSLFCKGCPSGGVIPEGQYRKVRYQLPPRGTPIIILTDLGIAQPSFDFGANSNNAWQVFITMTKQHECPIVAFVPYPPRCLPRELASQLAIIQWDRAMNVGKIRRVLAPFFKKRTNYGG